MRSGASESLGAAGPLRFPSVLLKPLAGAQRKGLLTPWGGPNLVTLDRLLDDGVVQPHFPEGSLMKGDGQRNRRLLSFSLAFMNILGKIRIDCARNCALEDCA